MLFVYLLYVGIHFFVMFQVGAAMTFDAICDGVNDCIGL